MTPAEEDAIYCAAMNAAKDENGAFSWNEAIRLAIRAAVAHERERAAKVCDVQGCECPQPETPWERGYAASARQCAAAIREGK